METSRNTKESVINNDVLHLTGMVCKCLKLHQMKNAFLTVCQNHTSVRCDVHWENQLLNFKTLSKHCYFRRKVEKCQLRLLK